VVSDDGSVPHATARRRIVRVRLDESGSAVRSQRPDTLAVEEPLELRLGDEPFTVTMRTPGHDLELALGFLLAEGVIAGPGDVRSARHCPDAARDADGNPTHNVVEVLLAPGVALPSPARYRNVTSACGICGTESIEAVRARSGVDLRADTVRLDAGVLAALPDRLRTQQRVFERTGGLHAAGLFTAGGELLCLREDVGRHNAVDKVVGWALQAGRIPLAGSVLQVSGRASFELVQKAWMAGCPVLAAVSAPSSLAVELAEDAGMTLIGFSRGTGFNVYAGVDRLGD
jgi:FdhD protein